LPRQRIPNQDLSEEAMMGSDILSFGRDAAEYHPKSDGPDKWV
jgi:hypothetical protein